MAKETICDACGKKFSRRDDYVNGKIALSYVEYHGDDGSDHVSIQRDLCVKCLQKVVALIEKVVKL